MPIDPVAFDGQTPARVVNLIGVAHGKLAWRDPRHLRAVRIVGAHGRRILVNGQKLDLELVSDGC